MTARAVVIGGGGTGGHLYPSLVVGRKLRQMDPRIELTYVGTRRDVEKTIMSAQGVRFVPLKVEGLKGRGLRSLKALAILPWSFLQSFRILRRMKPGLVIGAGGYSSGPLVLLASWMGIPTLVLEPNAAPGFTNRLLARWVRKAVVAFDSALPYFRGKGVRLGNPVRDEFRTRPGKAHGPGLGVLVFGGSQGSRVLNEAMTSALPSLAPHRARLDISHQTGRKDLEWVADRYRRAGFAAEHVAAYFDDMPARFAAADLLVSRAGATTAAEIVASRKAAVLVPFAGAADDHQTRNARALEAAGGAEVIPESRLTPDLLAARILHYLGHPAELEAMEERLRGLDTPNAADDIARLCLGLMRGGAEEARP